LSVFVIECLHSAVGTQLSLVGYRPTVGILVALYMVAVYRGRAISALALLIS
jgi:hypothetical protein